jgi:hypothetical protein
LPRLEGQKQRSIAIFSAREERRVAVVEVVSPGNKDSAARATRFQAKLVELLESGLHVVVIDVLPPTRTCRGFALAVAHDLGGGEPPAIRDRSAVSFEVSSPRVNLYARTLELGVALPDDVPLFLKSGCSVALPLEASYAETFERLPTTDRATLA